VVASAIHLTTKDNTMYTELINKLKQIESLTTEVLAMTQEKPKEHPFIGGENVQVRDYNNEPWRLAKFDYFDRVNTNPFRVTGCGAAGWRQCRRPVGVDNILIRWFGGECPVAPEKEVIVFYRDGRALNGRAMGFGWKHLGRDNDIIAYMTINLGDK
jgi:hypothetical protein